MSTTPNRGSEPAMPGEKNMRFGQPNDCNEGKTIREEFAMEFMKVIYPTVALDQRVEDHLKKRGIDITDLDKLAASLAVDAADALLAELAK